MKSYNYNSVSNAGSVLMIVVALLGFVSMLGMTFMIVVSADSKQSKSLARHSIVAPAGEEIVNSGGQVLLDDLHIGDHGPFSALRQSDPDRFKKYIDMSDVDIDPYLAQVWSNGAVGRFSKLWLSSTSTGLKVDMDSDELPDADLMDIGLVDPEGRPVYMAVRVLDTSAFANVNTAWVKDLQTAGDLVLPIPATTVNFNLGRVAKSSGTAKALVAERCNGDRTISPTVYWNQAASRITQPFNPSVFIPFSIMEETCLRDTKPVFRPLRFGRLLPILGSSNPEARLLTTYSVTRSILRNPTASNRYRLSMNTTFLNTNANRQWLYAELLAATADATDENNKKEVAHFVANLWAYVSTSDPTTESFAFQPTDDEPWTAYGVVPQMVLTEVFAYNDKESVPGAADHGWAYGIEMLNPTSQTIDISKYVMMIGSNEYEFKNSNITSIPAGKTVIVYTFDGEVENPKVNATANHFNFHLFASNTDIAKHIKIDPLFDDFHTEDIVLVRRLNTSNGLLDIPVDSVTHLELDNICGYNITNIQTEDGKADIRRDNHWKTYNKQGDFGGRARSTVAEYLDFTRQALAIKRHRLGKSNQINSDDIDVLEGFFISTIARSPELAELADVFVTGPDSDGTDLPHQLVAYKDEPSRGKLDYYGPRAPADSKYPQLPWAMITSELLEPIKTDTIRTDTPSRVYGRININTASREVLVGLPWPPKIWTNTPESAGGDYYGYTTLNKEALAEAIIAYRETSGGFLTPGQLVEPLKSFIDPLILGTDTKDTSTYAAVGGEKLLYRKVSNLISVRSDSFIILVMFQSATQKWRYIAMIDRSNCKAKGDKPVVLLFSQIR
ncbi:MAG TPA: hypothetical protein ENL03_00365 [Phycisphaerae bacterium]|nr:hypothetical protein [Phycisphaerae bacterium]